LAVKRLFSLLAALAAILTAGGGGAVLAQSAPAVVAAAMPPLEVYGRLPGLEQVEVSPDGTRLAFIMVAGEARRLMVVTLAGQTLAQVGLGDQKVRAIGWGDNDHVLITTSFTGRVCTLCDKQEVFVAQSFSISRKAFAQLLKDAPEAGTTALGGAPWVRRVDGKDIVLVEGYLGPEQDYRAAQFLVNLDTGQGRVYDFNFGVMDEHGYIVAATQHFAQDGGRWRLVTGARTGIKELFVRADVGLDPPELLGYGRTEGTVLLKVLEDDQWAYYEIDLVSGARKPFATPPGAQPIFDPRTDHYLGMMTLAGDAYSYSFDDPAIAAAWAKVNVTFRGKNPQIVSWTQDYRKAVVRTDGPTETGSFYYMDFTANTATLIGTQYPSVKPEQVSETRYIAYKAADGMEIPAYLTLPRGREAKGLPLVVMPHGGPQSRDDPGFDWWAQALAARGYAVLRPQFRGSDGFGVAHTRAGYGEWGRKMQTDLSDGVRWLASQGTVDPARVCIVGASYGGYAAMAGVSLDPGVYRCAVAVAGVSDLKRFLAWERTQTGAANSLGVRFWRRFMGSDQGGDATLAAISPAQQAARFYAPILLIHGKDDLVVPYEQSELLARALQRAGKPVELVTLQGEDHWLTRGATRLQMLQATVAFLERHNPPA
jgi:dipeptidyl aminopeptidase/acylaminoacyl peptidase